MSFYSSFRDFRFLPYENDDDDDDRPYRLSANL